MGCKQDVNCTLACGYIWISWICNNWTTGLKAAWPRSKNSTIRNKTVRKLQRKAHSTTTMPRNQCRRTKTLLSTTNELLLPKTIRASTVQNAITERQHQIYYYYDRLTQPLSQLGVGDSVKLECNKTWKKARITGISEAPRSYWVATPEGQT